MNNPAEGGGYNLLACRQVPRCSAAEFESRACPGVHTRDL
jgi:hypothetical protein